MKEIQLTQNKVALIDDEDFLCVAKFKWYAHHNGRHWYAKANYHGSKLFMHRLIMCTPESLVVDHIDNDGLNNQKSNLRNCTTQQNLRNCRNPSNTKGVTFDKVNNKFMVQIRLNGKMLKLGRFKTELEAAKAYNEAAIKYCGGFASLNSINEGSKI